MARSGSYDTSTDIVEALKHSPLTRKNWKSWNVWKAAEHSEKGQVTAIGTRVLESPQASKSFHNDCIGRRIDWDESPKNA